MAALCAPFFGYDLAAILVNGFKWRTLVAAHGAGLAPDSIDTFS